ncbi:hypothetical protein JTB14_006276 [Gonioctena quinquepunctata]|nr:hypothetical protein JTB14_006276 [Gonioctena quinquepunctata]
MEACIEETPRRQFQPSSKASNQPTEVHRSQSTRPKASRESWIHWTRLTNAAKSSIAAQVPEHGEKGRRDTVDKRYQKICRSVVRVRYALDLLRFDCCVVMKLSGRLFHLISALGPLTPRQATGQVRVKSALLESLIICPLKLLGASGLPTSYRRGPWRQLEIRG